MGGSGSGVLTRLQSRCLPGPHSEGFPGARGFTSKVAHSHALQVNASLQSASQVSPCMAAGFSQSVGSKRGPERKHNALSDLVFEVTSDILFIRRESLNVD